MEYTGLDFFRALELPCDLFLLCCRNRLTERLQETGPGREYLDDCRRLGRRELDRQGLSALQGRLACIDEQEV